MTPDPNPQLTDGDTENEGLADRAAGRLERDRPIAAIAGALGRSPLMEHWTQQMSTLVGDLDQEAAADRTMLETVQQAVAHRPPEDSAGVDLAAVKAVDSGFDDQQFLSASREALLLERKARAVRDPRFAEGLLAPQLAAALEAAVAGDESSQRHHVEPQLEIASCAITAAGVDNGVPTVVVRFHLTGEELDRDTSMRVIAGGEAEAQWDEEWTFARTAANGADAVDEDHELRTAEQGGWMLAHRGWVATSIRRIGAADPLDPQNI